MIRSIKIGDLDFYQDDSNVAGQVQLEHGIHYERHIVDEFRKWLPTSIGFADIGANAGIHTIIAKSIRRDLPIVCAEASPTNVKLILKNILNNALIGIKILPFAISNEYQILGINGCYFNSHVSTDLGIAHPEPCAAFPLDMLRLPDVDLIKIDVEGFELRVIEGMSQWMNLHPRIIFEYCPEHIALSGRQPEDLLHFFFDCHYRLTVLDYWPGMRRECFSVKEVVDHLAATSKTIFDVIAEPK